MAAVAMHEQTSVSARDARSKKQMTPNFIRRRRHIVAQEKFYIVTTLITLLRYFRAPYILAFQTEIAPFDQPIPKTLNQTTETKHEVYRIRMLERYGHSNFSRCQPPSLKLFRNL